MTYYAIAGTLMLLVFILVMIQGDIKKRRQRNIQEIIQQIHPPLAQPKSFVKPQNFMGRMFNRMRGRTDYHV